MQVTHTHRVNTHLIVEQLSPAALRLSWLVKTEKTKRHEGNDGETVSTASSPGSEQAGGTGSNGFISELMDRREHRETGDGEREREEEKER